MSTWATDSIETLLMELYIDITFITGCLMYLMRRKSFLWLIVLAPAIFGQLLLLFYIDRESLLLSFFWCFALSPAVYMNFKVGKWMSSPNCAS